MEIICERCGSECEFDPEEYGHMTWCLECGDYPQADIDAAYSDYVSAIADAAIDAQKYKDVP